MKSITSRNMCSKQPLQFVSVAYLKNVCLNVNAHTRCKIEKACRSNVSIHHRAKNMMCKLLTLTKLYLTPIVCNTTTATTRYKPPAAHRFANTQGSNYSITSFKLIVVAMKQYNLSKPNQIN